MNRKEAATKILSQVGSVAMSKVLMNRSVFLLQAFSKFSVCLKIIQKAGN